MARVLAPQQRRDQVTREEEEDGDAEATRHDVIEPGVSHEHDAEGDRANTVERGDFESGPDRGTRSSGGVQASSATAEGKTLASRSRHLERPQTCSPLRPVHDA